MQLSSTNGRGRATSKNFAHSYMLKLREKDPLKEERDAAFLVPTGTEWDD